MDNSAFFKIGYGLYLLTAREDGRDNGCIINTLQQLTDEPKRIGITVSKQNLTHDMVLRTGVFSVSALSEAAGFDVFRHFGFQSGRDAEKVAGYPGMERAANGLAYLAGPGVSALFSGRVFHTVDLGTHTLFLADATEAQVLSQTDTASYTYYQRHIKPKPAASGGWRCRVCGYVYHGETLPEGFICPLCKHGASAFEKLPSREENSAMKKYVCDICGYVYDEAAGDPDHGIAPGTKWEDVPEDYVCPLCGVGKDNFSEE